MKEPLTTNIECIECDKTVEARLLRFPPPCWKYEWGRGRRWVCPNCKNYVGNDPKTNKPLGIIPTKDLRYWRQAIHSRLDPLWKGGHLSRSKTYKIIAKSLGVKEYHTANVRSWEEARAILRIVDELRDKYKVHEIV